MVKLLKSKSNLYTRLLAETKKIKIIQITILMKNSLALRITLLTRSLLRLNLRQIANVIINNCKKG